MNTNPLPHPYLAAAETAAQQIVLALNQRGLSPAFRKFGLVESNGLTWMLAYLDERVDHLRLEQYTSPETLHQINTLLRGKRAFLSNSTGIRYAVLLSAPPRLPKLAQLPEEAPEADFFPLGVGLRGPLSFHAQRLLNILIGGAPESGKSTLLLLIAHTARQHGYSLYLADPQENTFGAAWNGSAAAPVAASVYDFQTLLESVRIEMERRRALFGSVAEYPPKNLEAYNQIAEHPLPRVFLIVDEANSYFDRKGVIEMVADLARQGRKWGLNVVLAAHNWRAKDVPRSLSTHFRTRICLTVNDDTSGDVVLNSSPWGKLARRLRQPGRGILYQDNYQLFQAYYISPEQEQNLLNSPAAMTGLADWEARLALYAVENLQGEFIVNRLAAAFAGEGITSHRVKLLAQRWERRGWLTTPRHATDARRVTDELHRLLTAWSAQAHRPHRGAQGAQGQ